jgi:hypothetical protein
VIDWTNQSPGLTGGLMPLSAWRCVWNPSF